MNAKIRMKMAFLAFSVIGVLQSSLVYGQQKLVDSLKKVLITNRLLDTNRVKLLNDIAFYNYSIKLSDLVYYSNEALKLATKLNYRKGQACSYNNMGLGYLGNNADPRALVYFDKAFKLYTFLNSKENCAAILSNIGYYYSVIKDHRQELKYMLQAYNELKDIDLPLTKATILGNIGAAYENLQDLKKAKAYFQQDLNLCIKNNLTSEIITCLTNLATVALKEKNIKSSLAYCNRALSIRKAHNNNTPRDLVAIYLIQSEIFYDLLQYDKSRKLLGWSRDLLKNLGGGEFQLQIYNRTYLLDSVSGNLSSALKNHLQFTQLKDSLNNVTKSHIVAFYQAKFEAEKKSNENQKLNIEKIKNEAIISNQHIIQRLLICGLTVFLGGIIYLFYINKHIRRKNEIINNQNIVKDKLFSVISHDLRSRLAQAVNMLAILDIGDLDITELKAIAPVIKRDMENVLTVMDNLLVWSKNQLKGFQCKPETLNIFQLTEEVQISLLRQFEIKQIDAMNITVAEYVAFADKEMIRIVLRNLISNAIKFTPVKGKIRVSSELIDDHIVICVEDNGMGIKKADQEKLFSKESFTTLGTANEKGTGLGLQICYDLVVLNKGRIWAESSEKQGSRFYFSLPVAH